MKNTLSTEMEKFDFEDINLVPKKCIVNSRSECDCEIEFGGKIFKLPIVPANMECVLDSFLAKKLALNGYFYILHRFLKDEEVIDFVKYMNSHDLISSISLGVNEDSFKLLESLLDHKLTIDFITVDIAHGHSVKMERMLKFIKIVSPKTFVIAGNISTQVAAIDLEDWGADALKVGIGPGSACTTYPTTGFGSRNCQASTIYHCANSSSLPIVADGGIKTPGDIAKALALGATMIMTGGMLSGYSDSPGHVVEVDGKKFKEFWGSASNYQSGKSSRIEGRKNLVDYKNESLFDGLKYIEECLQSSISYGGGKDLSAFDSVKWI
jgi:GMP reductase